MLISQKSKEIIDSCRFCWMCRHICPIGNATGLERNTSRARALALSYVERGAASLSDCIDNVYECALCGACTKECATGWDPVVFTKDVRREAALEGITPAYITALVEKFAECGSIYGKTSYCECLDKAIDTLPAKSDTLLYIGSDARYLLPSFAVKAIEALKKGGVDFTAAKGAEPDSGIELDTLVGAVEETKDAARKCAEYLGAYKTVIVLDPQDAKMFIREYKEWGIDLGCEIKTLTSVLASLAADGKLRVAKTEDKLTVQDNPLLARELSETEDVRTLVEKKGVLAEMLLNRRDTMFCGSFIMNEWMSDVMTLTAKKRMANILETGAKTVVVTSPAEYAMLDAVKEDGITVLSAQELVL